MTHAFEHGYALLIGVDDNVVPRARLPYAATDIDELHKVLINPERCGYATNNVMVLTRADSSSKGISDGLMWLRRRLEADIRGNTTAIIYFTGHGIVLEGDYYLVPYDYDENRIDRNAVPAAALAREIATMRCKRLLVVLDCCHAAGMGVKDFDPVFQSVAIPPAIFMPRTKGLSKRPIGYTFEPLEQGAGRAVLSSSRADEPSYIRRDQRMSIFTCHFVEALTGHAQPTGGATEVLVSDIMSHVHRRVLESARADWNAVQSPQYETSGSNFAIALLHGGKGLSVGSPPPDLLGPSRAPPSRSISSRAITTDDRSIPKNRGETPVSDARVQISGSKSPNINTGTQIITTGGGAVIFGGVRIENGDFNSGDKGGRNAGGVRVEKTNKSSTSPCTQDAPNDEQSKRRKECEE